MEDILRVLIVDDNPEYSNALKSCFETSGLFRVFPCLSSGAEALAAMRAEPCDIFILDMIMPEMDGISVLQAMRADGIGQDAMIFATSPFYLGTEILQKAQDMGVAYFFYKPVSPKTVYSRISDMVNDRLRLAGKQRNAVAEANIRCDEYILNYLRLMGVRPHLKGYHFLKTGLQYCVERYGRILHVTTDVYPYIAEQYGTKVSCVERNIRTAIDYAWNHGNIEAQHKVFGYTVDSHKGTPTAKEFLAMLCERIVIRMKMI